MHQFFDFADALKRLLGRPVDLVERAEIEVGRNYVRRRRILAEAEPMRIVPWQRQAQNPAAFANLHRWFEAVPERPDTKRAYADGEPYSQRPSVIEEGKKLLFGQPRGNRPTGG